MEEITDRLFLPMVVEASRVLMENIVREQGGVMDLSDLAEFQPEWVQPIETNYRGWTVAEIPPNSQGIAALEMLNILERFPIGEMGFHSTRALHTMIEAKKLAYADLIRYVGDPRFGRIPVGDLLGKESAAARASLIDPQKASCKVEPTRLAAITDAKGSDTIYLSVVDGDGMSAVRAGQAANRRCPSATRSSTLTETGRLSGSTWSTKNANSPSGQRNRSQTSSMTC